MTDRLRVRRALWKID